MILDRTKPQQSSGGDFELLETDVYTMELKSCTLEDDQFSPNDDGTFKQKYVLRWEDEESGNAVWQRFNPFYGLVKGGAPSKWMAFIDSLADQGMLPDGPFDPEEALVGIRQRVSVEKYIKTMGANKGQPGNRVVAVLPLKRAKAQPKASAAAPAKPAEDYEIPF